MITSEKKTHQTSGGVWRLLTGGTGSGNEWSSPRAGPTICSQLTTGLLCCLAFVVSVVCLIRTLSLEQKIWTLESNCEKYETLIHKLIENYDLLAIKAIKDITGNYDMSTATEGTGFADTVPQLDINAIIEEVFIA
jgi:hypothetical protein